MSEPNAYQAIIRKAWNSATPTSALLELTYLCNHLCTFCNNPIDRFVMGQPRPTDEREMTAAEFIDTLGKLHDLNVLFLTLSGGEPLVRPDFFEIGREARRLGFGVRVFTNGYLIDEEMARRLRDEISPIEMSISLHGAEAGTHDALTRIPGSFDRLVEGIRHLRRVGLNVQLKTVITKLNYAGVREIKALADDLDARIIFDPVVTPRFDGNVSPLAMRAPDSFYAEFYGEAYDDVRGGRPVAPREMDDGFTSCCGTGRNTMMIDPYGNIYPCSVWYRKAGNIKEIEDLAAFWGDSPVLREVRAISKRAKEEVLPMYEHAAFAAFCPAINEDMTGDPLKISPQHDVNARHAHAAWDRRRAGAEAAGTGPEGGGSGGGICVDWD